LANPHLKTVETAPLFGLGARQNPLSAAGFQHRAVLWHTQGFLPSRPLPLQDKTNASVLILLALYAWNLIVLFNFVNDRPLGAVKPVLDLL
jgi:hypothetical protein